MSLFVGLDLSIAHTGLCIYDDEGMVEHGVINSKAEYPDIPRFERTADAIENRIRHWHKKDGGEIYVLIEEYAFSAKGQMTRIAENGAIIKSRLFAMTPWENIWVCAPGTLKMFGTGKGNTPKSAVVKEVFKKFGFDTNNDNEADAYCLARMRWADVTGQDLLETEKKAIIALHKTNRVEIEYAEKGVIQKRSNKRKKIETPKKRGTLIKAKKKKGIQKLRKR